MYWFPLFPFVAFFPSVSLVYLSGLCSSIVSCLVLFSHLFLTSISQEILEFLARYSHTSLQKCTTMFDIGDQVHLCFSPQDTGTLEKHSFATSTFTQFCILFKRTFITICRDTVNWQLLFRLTQPWTDLARPITLNVNLLCFEGADPPQGDVPPVYWSSDWHALSQNWKWRQ